MQRDAAPRSHGLMAEFESSSAVTAAARRARMEGYTRLDAYSPFPVEALAEALGHTSRGWLPAIVLAGGVVGGLGGYMLQYWTSVHAYPLVVGGKPLHSWPAFVPVTFECVVLGAALAAVVGMLALNGLPRPYHPVFNVPAFAAASRNRFFLCVEATDPKFDATATRRFLEGLAPVGVYDVEP
jgi:hypothetical protein